MGYNNYNERCAITHQFAYVETSFHQTRLKDMMCKNEKIKLITTTTYFCKNRRRK